VKVKKNHSFWKKSDTYIQWL